MVNIQSKSNAKKMLVKVPEITILFWIIKILTTGMGEIFSDFLCKQINPVVAVLLGGLFLLCSLLLQFMVRRYIPYIYWLAVLMVSIVGTMFADVLHVVIGIPYIDTTILYITLLAAVFAFWYFSEKTLSIHSVYTTRREIFYWLTVLITFALGTATGDLTAYTMHLGYFTSAVLFAILIILPLICYKLFKLNEVFLFWFAYILTRPLGASLADWLSVSKNRGGLGFGTGIMSLVLFLIIVLLVVILEHRKYAPYLRKRGEEETIKMG
jgi:Uncharacterized membrane-anchored protein conserved in bacteria